MNTLDALRWRYATKKFDAQKKLSDADLEELLEALRLSPSSYGLQPWKFIVVTDPAVRAELRKHSWDQSQITDASHLLVLCAKKTLTEEHVEHYLEAIAQTRGVPLESLSGFRKMLAGSITGRSEPELLAWNKNQVYIPLGMLLATAASKRIDACPMEGFDPAGFSKVLGLEAEGLVPVVLCPLGYRASDDPSAQQKKVRFCAEEVIIRA